MAKTRNIPKPPNPQPNITTASSLQPSLTLQTMSASALNLIISILQLINSVLMAICYFLLVIQTVAILNSKEPKYINLRHIALKWLACIMVHCAKQGFVHSTDVNSHMMVIVLDLISIAIAYPSRALKMVHLKYFSHKEQQRYHESVSDPNQYDATFASKVYISITVTLLSFCKHLIALVLPQHRRPIEDALRAINAVVIDRKCFWSIYNNGNEQQQIFQKDKATVREYLVSGSTLGTTMSTNSLMMGSNGNFQNQPQQLAPTSLKQSKEVIKAYGEKCSNIITNGFKPLKRVSIKYMIAQSKLEILDLDFAKVEVYILEELTERDSNVVEFTVLSPGQKNSQPLYIKFKSARELEIFMKSIQDSQKVF